MPDAVYGLRRYRLRPAKRESLVELFESSFVEPQEQTGMSLHGLYRDRDDPDAFVWMRSFADMTARSAALASSYGGEVWRKFDDAANATMLNSDNVLLLKHAGAAPPFAQASGPGGVVTISTASLAPDRETTFAETWAERARPVLEACGARIDATFVTDRRPNEFRRLPVREGETVMVWVAAFPDDQHLASFESALARSEAWTSEVWPWLDAQLWRPLQTAVLTPTRRSRHGW